MVFIKTLPILLLFPSIFASRTLNEVDEELSPRDYGVRKASRRIGRRLPTGISPEWYYSDNELSPYSGYNTYNFLKAAKNIPRLGRRWDVPPHDELVRELANIANSDSSEEREGIDISEDPTEELMSKYFDIWLRRRLASENDLEDRR